MKIGNVRNYNRSFGVKIDSYTAKGMRETAKNIIEKNGENSEEFRQLVEDVKVIAEKYEVNNNMYVPDAPACCLEFRRNIVQSRQH